MGLKVFTHLLSGEATHMALSTSSYYDCTAVVMGTTGKGSFEDMLLGSTSHRLVERSEVSVILVPNREKSDYDE